MKVRKYWFIEKLFVSQDILNIIHHDLISSPLRYERNIYSYSHLSLFHRLSSDFFWICPNYVGFMERKTKCKYIYLYCLDAHNTFHFALWHFCATKFNLHNSDQSPIISMFFCSYIETQIELSEKKFYIEIRVWQISNFTKRQSSSITKVRF